MGGSKISVNCVSMNSLKFQFQCESIFITNKMLVHKLLSSYLYFFWGLGIRTLPEQQIASIKVVQKFNTEHVQHKTKRFMQAQNGQLLLISLQYRKVLVDR